MTDIAISVRNVAKRYQVFDNNRARLLHHLFPQRNVGMTELWALKDINIEIRRGEAVAIMGRNGGGKSTLLEVLTGTLTPTVGEVTVRGRVSALLELGSGFNPEYSGRDNVVLNGLLLGLTKEEILARFNEIETFAEIGPAIDRPVKTYSSGMMVRLAFAVQVLCDPDILIIDEALSVGDFFFQQKCLAYIRKLKQKGVTLLFVSHDMGSVRDTCERGIVLRRGEIVFDGENLQAIRRYLENETDAAVTTTTVKNPSNHAGQAAVSHSHDVLWRADELSQAPVQILSVDMRDEEDRASNSIQMASRAKFLIRVRADDAIAPHVCLQIKNKHNQIITSIGTHGLGVVPATLGPSFASTCEFELKMSIEAGEYVIRAYVVDPGAGGGTGKIIEQTPWLGPIQVNWNYEQDIPPFTGMFGLDCKGRYLDE